MSNVNKLLHIFFFVVVQFSFIKVEIFVSLLKLWICHVLYFKYFTTKTLKKLYLMYFNYSNIRIINNNELLYKMFCAIFLGG